MAFGKVDDRMRIGLAKSKHCAFLRSHAVQGCPAPRAWRRQMHGQDLRALNSLPLARVHNAIMDKLSEHALICMLELATAAFTEVSAGWLNVMGSASGKLTFVHLVSRQSTGNVGASRRYTVPARGKADNFFISVHRQLL